MSVLNESRSRPGGRQAFSFPSIKPSDIVLFLKDLGIYITEDDILNPDKNKDLYRRTLEQLAEMSTGITRDEMSQPAFSGLAVLNYPELHEESIYHLNTFRACSKMMEVCSIHDFSIRDFMAPAGKRFRKQLSGIINFLMFKLERVYLLDDLKNTKNALTTNLDNLNEKNDQLRSRLDLLLEQTAEEADVISQIENECSEIEEHISSLNLTQAKIREDSADLKALNNQLKDSISAKQLEVEENQSMKKTLSGQIVSSPERFRKQIVDVGKSLQGEQKDTKAAEKRVRELGVWICNLEEAQTDVNSALEAVQELRTEVERQKAVVVEAEAKKHQIEERRGVLMELEQNVLQIQRQSSRAEEKLQHLRKQATGRSTEDKREIDELHKQLIEAENFRLQVYNRVEKTENDAASFEKKREAEITNLEQEYADMVTTYQRLERVVVSHLQGIRNAIEDEPPAHVA